MITKDMLGPCDDGAYGGAFDESRKKLKRLLPTDIASATNCSYSKDTSVFKIVSFGQHFDITWPQGDVCFSDTSLKPEIGWRLILLNYFSAAKNIPLSGNWISYKDQPRGAIFYPNIRRHIIEPMGIFYDQCHKKILNTALDQIGFTRIEGKADLTAEAFFAPRIPVRIQFWSGDEEFPGAFQILFDHTISEQMHIEDSVSLCGLIESLLRSRYAQLL